MIEFGLALPVLLILLSGITDLARGFSEQYRLQQVVNRSLEIAQANRDTSYDHLVPEAVAAAGTGATATLEQWLECGGARRAWDDPCPSGTPARFVKLTVWQGYKPLFGDMSYPRPGADGIVRLSAHALLRVN